MVCKKAPATDKIANPPYSIHNFGWKDGATNNDVRDQAIDGIPTERLDAKAISVTAREEQLLEGYRMGKAPLKSKKPVL